MGFTDSHHLRKMTAGVCMVLAPLLFLAAFIVSPKLETGAVAQLRVAASHIDRFYISGLIGVIGLVLLVPAGPWRLPLPRGGRAGLRPAARGRPRRAGALRAGRAAPA